MSGEGRARAIAIGIGAGMVSAMAILTLSQSQAHAKAMMLGGVSPSVAKVLETARRNPAGARHQIEALYYSDAFRSGDDYTAAARLLLGSPETKKLALAHDCAIAGLVLGDLTAKPVIAESEDRLFAKLGLGERYGILGHPSGELTRRHCALLGVKSVFSIAKAR